MATLGGGHRAAGGAAELAADFVRYGSPVIPRNGCRSARRFFEFPGRMAGAATLMFIAMRDRARARAGAHALRCAPLRDGASAGLLIVATSLAGLALGNASLASLGLDRAPSIFASPARRRPAGRDARAPARRRLDLGPARFDGSGRSRARHHAVDRRRTAAHSHCSPSPVCARAITAWTSHSPRSRPRCAVDSRSWFCGTRRESSARSSRDACADEEAQLAANRLRLAKSATGVQMWEWSPRTREWLSLDGEARLDPSTNEFLEAGLARCLRDGQAEFEFALRRPGREEQWMLATCWRELRDGPPIVIGVTVDITERKRPALRIGDQRIAAAARGVRLARFRLRLELRQRQDPAHLRHRTDARLPRRGDLAGQPLVGRAGPSGRSRVVAASAGRARGPRRQ